MRLTTLLNLINCISIVQPNDIVANFPIIFLKSKTFCNHAFTYGLPPECIVWYNVQQSLSNIVHACESGLPQQDRVGTCNNPSWNMFKPVTADTKVTHTRYDIALWHFENLKVHNLYQQHVDYCAVKFRCRLASTNLTRFLQIVPEIKVGSPLISQQPTNYYFRL